MKASWFPIVVALGVGIIAGHLSTRIKQFAFQGRTGSTNLTETINGHATNVHVSDTSSTSAAPKRFGRSLDDIETILIKAQRKEWHGCIHAWNEVMRDVDDETATMLLPKIQAIPDKSVRINARDALLGQWAKSNPNAAIRAAE